MSHRNKEYTNRNSDPYGVHLPKKKYKRLRPSDKTDRSDSNSQNKSGFCLVYFLVGFGITVLYITI